MQIASRFADTLLVAERALPVRHLSQKGVGPPR